MVGRWFALVVLAVGAGSGDVIDSPESGFTSHNREVVDGVLRGQLEGLARDVEGP